MVDRQHHVEHFEGQLNWDSRKKITEDFPTILPPYGQRGLERGMEALRRTWSLLSKFSLQEIYRTAHLAYNSDYRRSPGRFRSLVTA